ncbi:unnamed protein product, partial [Prorocentrum cordatum]
GRQMALPASAGAAAGAGPPPACRFCLEEGGADLLRPCLCRGTGGLVHLACLVRHFLAQGDWHNFACPTCGRCYEGRALRELAALSRGRVEEEHGPQAPQVAHSVCYLAQAHAQLGDAARCRELLETALAISEAHWGRGHVATAAILAELASAHGKLGNVQVQKDLLETSLEIKERHFGADHINTAVTLNNLATVYRDLGDLPRELALLERSMEIQERRYGRGSVETTAAMVNLAGAYGELGDAPRGRRLLERALAIEQQHFGAGHVETAITLNNLAMSCGEGGDTQRMLRLLHQSLAIKERHFGPDHGELCLTLANLGIAWGAAGEEEAARGCCSRALRASAPAPEAPSGRRHGAVLIRAASVRAALLEWPEAEELAGLASARRRESGMEHKLREIPVGFSRICVGPPFAAPPAPPFGALSERHPDIRHSNFVDAWAPRGLGIFPRACFSS